MSDEIQTNVEVVDEMENMYLNVNVGNEVYGIEIRYVLQIMGMQDITEMPEMSTFMKGYINIRGNVIPVVSMRIRFGKPEEEYNDRTCIVVVQIGEREIGLIVDAIRETITIDPSEISPQPATSVESAIPYVKGVAHLSGNATAVIIDIQKLFENNSF